MRTPAIDAARGAGLLGEDLPYQNAAIDVMPRLMQSLLGRRVHAITIGSVVYVNREHHHGVLSGEEPELLAHELIHVAQWASEGVWPFLRRYVSDYLRLRLLGLDHRAAYRRIGFEWDAYEAAARMVRPT